MVLQLQKQVFQLFISFIYSDLNVVYLWFFMVCWDNCWWPNFQYWNDWKTLNMYWFSSPPDSTGRDTKIFAYQAIGLLASRMPNLFRHDIFLKLSWLLFHLCYIKEWHFYLYYIAVIKLTWLYDSLLLWDWRINLFVWQFKRRLLPLLQHIR